VELSIGIAKTSSGTVDFLEGETFEHFLLKSLRGTSELRALVISGVCAQWINDDTVQERKVCQFCS
jgi:hypothetical protein